MVTFSDIILPDEWEGWELTEKIGGEVKAECRDDRLWMMVRIERSKAIKI